MGRDEEKARTRAALIDAGAAEFGEYGFNGARVERIARRAGVTTGALYAHFKSKEDLYVAMIEVSAAYTLKDMAAVGGVALGTTTAPEQPDTDSPARRPLPAGGRAGVAGVADAWFRRHMENPGWFRLSVDFRLIAMTNPRLRETLKETLREVGSWLGALFEAVAAQQGRHLTQPAEQLARTAAALGYGLVLEALVDPESVPPHRFGDVLEDLYLAASEEISTHESSTDEAPAAPHDPPGAPRP